MGKITREQKLLKECVAVLAECYQVIGSFDDIWCVPQYSYTKKEIKAFQKAELKVMDRCCKMIKKIEKALKVGK